ncbi:MAG: DUF2807 domain-containing protein [Bacteroidetes bacterium]|nr:DUF2807 domain-containing protein [Bacteroidota bacterium]
MKNLSMYLVGLLIATTLFFGCTKDELCTKGEGTITTQTLHIPNFSGIDLQGAYDVVITQGIQQEVTATGHPNMISRLSSDVSNSIWKMGLNKGCYEDYELTVYITVPNMEDIEISGSGNVELNGFDNVNEFTIDINGSGSILGNADFSALEKLSIKISGSGEYLGFPISTDECTIKISGSGTCEVQVNNSLDVDISGSGNVYYKGNPSITQDISGSGQVINNN